MSRKPIPADVRLLYEASAALRKVRDCTDYIKVAIMRIDWELSERGWYIYTEPMTMQARLAKRDA